MTHYNYQDESNRHKLKQLTLAAIPNGILQDRYNPDPDDTIWIVGRNAPSRGEEFRVRLSFSRLKLKSVWRVQKIEYDPTERIVRSQWDE